MKQFRLIAFIALFLCAQARAAVVYNNFGSGDTYLTNIGWTVGLSPSGITFVDGDRFSVTGSDYLLDSITLPLAYNDGPSRDADIQLRADTGGLPGGVIEAFHFINLPSLSPIPTLPVVATSVAHPLLHDGEQYWITASAADPSMLVWQMNSIHDEGLHAASVDGSPFTTVSGVRGAFRVEGTAVPEPATTVLSLLGASSLCRFRRRTDPRR